MLVDGRGNELAGPPEELGWAPLVAALAPVAVSLVAAGGKALVGKLSSKKPPPCTFWQKFGRVFGGRPNCS